MYATFILLVGAAYVVADTLLPKSGYCWCRLLCNQLVPWQLYFLEHNILARAKPSTSLESYEELEGDNGEKSKPAVKTGTASEQISTSQAVTTDTVIGSDKEISGKFTNPSFVGDE